jgi:hypothetical protein
MPNVDIKYSFIVYLNATIPISKFDDKKVFFFKFVTRGQSDRGTKWPGDKVTRGQSDRGTKWPGYKVTGDKVTENKVTRGQSDRDKVKGDNVKGDKV